MNGKIDKFCNDCGLSYLFKNVSSTNSTYSFWVVAYNARKGYESEASVKVNISSSLFGKIFPNSLMVHKANAKEINTMKEVFKAEDEST